MVQGQFPSETRTLDLILPDDFNTGGRMEILTVTTAVLLFWACVILSAYVWYLRGRVRTLDQANNHNWGNSKAHHDQYVQSLDRIGRIRAEISTAVESLEKAVQL